MAHKIHDTGVSKHIGKYSDAIEAAPGLRWLHTSGTPGLDENGKLPPTIEEQSRHAWRNVFAALAKAGMTKEDIVKVTTSLTSAELVPAYVKVRSEFLGDVRPAFMLSIVPGLIWPNVLVEIEVIAAAR